MKSSLCIALLLLPCVVGSAPNKEFLSDSAVGIRALQTWYIRDTGLWKTTNWWNAANAVTVLAGYTKLSKSPEFKADIANTFDKNSAGKFLNQYYDDEGWWALAWAGAFEFSHEKRYLAMSEAIFADMATGWDDTCGGGIWWKKDKHYKNAIANELFLSVAAKLAALDKHRRDEYLTWAKKEWQWFAASGMINAQNLVNDGLDSACHNNHRNTWTYNQGVVLGGLSDLAKQSGDPKLVEQARSIALAAITNLTDKDGILHDSCEPRCGADAVQFKGIFARNLAALNAAAPEPQFSDFLRKNAESIWRNQDAAHHFGVVWSSGADPKNAATQVSALDALVGAAASSSAQKPH